jgi:hypothetical protein
MNWGKWIIVSFIFFAAFIATLVVVCVKQDVNLVSKDYYKDELAYQDQIERLTNAALLATKPEIIISGNELQVRFSQHQLIQKGELRLFRPSNEKLDQQFIVRHSLDSVQHFILKDVSKGMYKARLRWTMENKEYYLEKIVMI